MGTILVPLFAHYRPTAPPVQAAFAEGLLANSASFPCTDYINEAVTAPRPTAWAINRILALLFVLGPPEGAHAVLLLDRAGWHTTSKLVVPNNITPIFLPSRAPELNPVENIWQYLRQNWLAKHRLRELRRHRGRGPRRRGESSSPTPNGSL